MLFVLARSVNSQYICVLVLITCTRLIRYNLFFSFWYPIGTSVSPLKLHLHLGRTYNDWHLVFLRHTNLMVCLGWGLSMQHRAADASEKCGGPCCCWAGSGCGLPRSGSLGLPPSSTTSSTPHHNLGGGDFRPRLHPPPVSSLVSLLPHLRSLWFPYQFYSMEFGCRKKWILWYVILHHFKLLDIMVSVIYC
jgi:hypothetical protein